MNPIGIMRNPHRAARPAPGSMDLRNAFGPEDKAYETHDRSRTYRPRKNKKKRTKRTEITRTRARRRVRIRKTMRPRKTMRTGKKKGRSP